VVRSCASRLASKGGSHAPISGVTILVFRDAVGVILNKKFAGTPIAEHFAASESSELK